LAILRQAVAEEAPYSVAIIDLQMPVLDGLTLIRKINADPQLGATRLILLIPFGRSFDAGELKAVNIAACCIKPVRQSALLDCLVQVLARSTTTGATCLDEPYLRSDDFPKPRSERVLLAEDNVVNQEVALGNLRKLGYSADVVANGLEVLDALERKRYDIILMDCQMPELDGYKTTKEIRRREQKDHRTWIIAMTANVMVGDREKCIAAGMDDYVSKPSRRMELRAALNRVATTTVRQLDDDDVLRTLIEEGEDAFDRLVGLFFASAPASLAEMKRALAKTDTVDLVQSAHNLKGSCSNFGGSSLRELCTQIEQWGDGGQPGDIADLIVSVEKELAKLIERLKTYRKAGIP
jgi:two-component system, sensor histidine kinase and response regulator